MENKLFREKSLNKISSPDNLTDYIRVTTPGVWFVLVAIVLLLVGVCVWGIFGRIDTKIDAIVVVDDSEIFAVVSEDAARKCKIGDAIKVEDRTYSVTAIGSEAIELKVDDDAYLLHLLGKTDSCWVVKVSVSSEYLTDAKESLNGPLDKGYYESSIIVESIHPMSFITN